MRKQAYNYYTNVITSQRWWNVARRNIISALISQYIHPSGHFRILDAGCGSGAEIQSLQQFGDVCGVDVAEEMVNACHRHGLQTVKLGSVEALPYPDHVFQLVTCLDVLEHVKDDEGTLRELHRVIAPGGYLLITVPAHQYLWNQHDVMLGHYRRYSRQSLTNIVGRAKFKIVKCSYFNSHLFLPIACIKMINKIRPNLLQSQHNIIQSPPWLLNHVLASVFSAEGLWLPYINAPIGISIVLICKTATDQ